MCRHRRIDDGKRVDLVSDAFLESVRQSPKKGKVEVPNPEPGEIDNDGKLIVPAVCHDAFNVPEIHLVV